MSSSKSAVWIGSPFTQPKNEGVESDDPLQLENLVKNIFFFLYKQSHERVYEIPLPLRKYNWQLWVESPLVKVLITSYFSI